jgi:Variant SH3 domain
LRDAVENFPKFPKTKSVRRKKLLYFIFKLFSTVKYFRNIAASLAHLLFNQTSLADEMGSQTSIHHPFSKNSILALKCSYLLDEDSSPDSDRMHSFGDVDSGHSTAHSPNDFKSITPPNAPASPHSPFPPPFGGVPFSQLEMLEATHRGLHKFLPRHHDELEIEIGDPIYVQKEAEDLWCEGVNLRTGHQGVFPSAYIVDLEYNDFDPTTVEMKRERYLLGYLGSVETLSHKGTGVVCQAVRKIVGEGGDMTPKGQPCILEISDQGLRMVDRSKVMRYAALIICHKT